MTRLTVEVLGRPTVAVDGISLPLTARHLALVVRLAMSRQQPLSGRRLLGAWPDAAGTDGALRVALTRLRPLLAPVELMRLDSGYVLAPAAQLDADRFERLVRCARNADEPALERVGHLDEALALWRGPALDGLDGLDWASHESTRLDELHEQAIDLRYELLLESGLPDATDSVLPELAADTARRPGREHRAALLATALYRTGRQADALAVLHSVGAHLRNEFGLSPGRALDELELRILNRDPKLTAAVAEPGPHPAIERQEHAAQTLLRQGAAVAAASIADATVAAARVHGNRRQLAAGLLTLAQVVTVTGTRPPDPLVDEAQALGRMLGDGDLLARAALVRFGRGVPPDWHAALVELSEPLELLPPSAPARVELLSAAATIAAFDGHPVAADQILNAAAETHRAIGSAHTEAVWLAASAILGELDRARASVADAVRASELARSVDDPRLIVAALHAVLRVGLAAGNLAAVEASLASLEGSSLRAGLAFGRIRVPIVRASLAIARGHLDAAAAAIADTRRLGEQLGGHAAQPAASVQEIQVAIERGEGAAMLDTFRAMAGADPDVAWSALAAEHGDVGDLERLRVDRARLSAGDGYAVSLGLTARAAAVHRDRELGEWCAPRLSKLGPATVLLGFGTVLLGPAPLFVGQAHVARGAWGPAIEAFRHAERIAARAGAELWVAEARLWHALARAERAEHEFAEALVATTPLDPAWGRLPSLASQVTRRRVTGVGS